jgi:hypothetical protein
MDALDEEDAMTHPLVTQLRFARREFVRGFEEVPLADAVRRIEPMNSLSWTVGHLANQEQFLWIILPGVQPVVPGLHERVGTGQPGSAPGWDEMWEVWRAITAAADRYLDTLTPEALSTHLLYEGKPWREDIGTTLLRNTYHYWFHLGEAYALRELLGHTGLPGYVGRMDDVRYTMEG